MKLHELPYILDRLAIEYYYPTTNTFTERYNYKLSHRLKEYIIYKINMCYTGRLYDCDIDDTDIDFIAEAITYDMHATKPPGIDFVTSIIHSAIASRMRNIDEIMQLSNEYTIPLALYKPPSINGVMYDEFLQYTNENNTSDPYLDRID